MTVQDLVDKLKTLPPNAEVEVSYKIKDGIGYRSVITENSSDIDDVILLDYITPCVQIVIDVVS